MSFSQARREALTVQVRDWQINVIGFYSPGTKPTANWSEPDEPPEPGLDPHFALVARTTVTRGLQRSPTEEELCEEVVRVMERKA